jgi:site-specific recombinase XerD
METGHLNEGFRDALADFREGYMAARNLAARSRVEYETVAAQFLTFLQEDLGIGAVGQVGEKHVNAYLAHLDRLGLAGATRRRKLVILRTFFGWLKAQGVIEGNPAESIAPPQREEKEPRVLDKEEYQRLLSVVEKPRDRAIIQLLLQTGIRLAEIQRLRLADAHLPGRITKDALGTLRIVGKGRKTRTVLLNAKACEALATWLKARPEAESDALFLSNRKQPMTRRGFQYLVKKYLERAGITDAGVHTLRHTFATHHVAMGTDLVTVQEFLGHASLDTTRLYVGLARKRQAQHIQEHAL